MPQSNTPNRIPDGYAVRNANREDLPLLLEMIRELAAYENLEDHVVANATDMEHWIFEMRTAFALMAECEGQPVGYAICFYNFSTFLGKAGIYIEDIYVKPEHRSKGLGRAIIGILAQKAIRENCGRLEWACLDDNEPSIGFYRSLGARCMDEWTTWRLEGDTLQAQHPKNHQGE